MNEETTKEVTIKVPRALWKRWAGLVYGTRSCTVHELVDFAMDALRQVRSFRDMDAVEPEVVAASLRAWGAALYAVATAQAEAQALVEASSMVIQRQLTLDDAVNGVDGAKAE